VLTDLTVAVSPQHQKQGIARALFTQFFAELDSRMPHIKRVELIARESNSHALAFYESLGFVKEGRLEGRIKNPDGSVEADIPMAWRRAQA
jgi:putative acetyltransferase